MSEGGIHRNRAKKGRPTEYAENTEWQRIEIDAAGIKGHERDTEIGRRGFSSKAETNTRVPLTHALP